MACELGKWMESGCWKEADLNLKHEVKNNFRAQVIGLWSKGEMVMVEYFQIKAFVNLKFHPYE